MRQLLFLLTLVTATAAAQVPGTITSPEPPAPYSTIIPAKVEPVLGPGELTLIDLETRFAQAVAQGGGLAFANWFADDAITLSNGKPVVAGRGAIAASANWSPKDYSLTWTPQAAQMGPSGDMGFTWGHYEGRTLGPKPVITTGRYITIWRKQKDGVWKVVMDASADEPPSNDCCTVPKP